MPRFGWSVRSLLLGALLAVGVLLPPELHPWGLGLASVTAFALAWCLMRERDIPRLLLHSWRTVPAAALVALWVLPSAQPHTSITILFQTLLALIAFAAARREVISRSDEERLKGLFIALGSVVSLWGLYQACFGLAQTARMLRRLGQPQLDPLVLRAESGRAFGPFLLPADLGIYVAMLLPLTACGLLCEKRRVRRGIVGAALLTQMAALAASRSYGAVLSLLVSALVLLPASRIDGKFRIWAGFATTGLTATLGLFLLRGTESLSPLTLRLDNWRAAWQIFTDHPISGVGLGTFGDAYARWLTPGMNETVFAHNSYLQVAAEGGLPAAVAVLGGVGIVLWRVVLGLRRDPDAWGRLATVLPPVTFLVHNVFDFSAYLPSLLISCAALWALAMRPGSPTVPAPAPPDPMPFPRKIALGLLLAGAASWGLREAGASGLLEQARQALEEGQSGEAKRELLRAVWLSPAHPDPPAILSEVFLEEIASRPAARPEGEKWARLAVSLRPSRAYGHYVLSLYRLAAGDLGEAWVELSRARELFPSKDLYRLQEVRLREMITTFTGKAGMPDGR